MYNQPSWIDEAAGPLVRPYALTAGLRRRAAGDPREELDLITTIVAARPASTLDDELGSECSRIMGMCQRPLSVAEVSSQLRLPVGIVRALLGDLLDRGLLYKQSGVTSPTHDVFRAVINGLRSL